MTYFPRLFLLAGALLASGSLPLPARANEPPSDLCSLLPAADVSKTLGRTYDAPQKSVAPRPFANTAQGTDCNYLSKGSSKLWFRAYVDPSPEAAKDLFARLGRFYQPQSPVAGLGDEAYFDKDHGLHVRKGKVRFFLSLDVRHFAPDNEKQLKDLAASVAGQL